MEDKIIEIKELTKIYNEGKENEVIALDHTSFTLNRGEFAVILGPSGAGKSTLLNILGGMDEATSGSYIVDEIDVLKLDNKELTNFRRYDIGFVFQFYNLIPNLTALENVKIAASVARNPLDSATILEKVGLKNRLGNFPPELSGGEQQRVSIARAIVKNPKLLLCDEPTGALDSKTGAQILQLLKDVAKDYKITVLMVTHNSKIAECAERVIEVRDGKIASNRINDNPMNIKDVKW